MYFLISVRLCVFGCDCDMKACDITWYLIYLCKDDSHGINQSKTVVSKDLEVKINDKLKFFFVVGLSMTAS